MWTRAVKSGAKTALIVAIASGLVTFVDHVVASLPSEIYTPLVVALAGVIKSFVKKWELENTGESQ